jgi:uncharacterized protein (TIGR02147 family)
MHGKRSLGVDSIPQVIRSLRLNKAEGEYFTHLVHYNQATTFESREHYFQKILSTSRQSHPSLVKDAYRFFASHRSARVHLYLTLRDVEKTIEAIAKQFNLNISEASEILQNLEKCGHAYFNKETQHWISSEKNLTIPEELGNLALQSFHKESLKEAQKSVELSPAERHFETLVMTLTPQEYQEAKKELGQFFDYLAKKFSSQKLEQAKIYQFNTNLIPVSKELIRAKEEARSLKPMSTDQKQEEKV